MESGLEEQQQFDEEILQKNLDRINRYETNATHRDRVRSLSLTTDAVRPDKRTLLMQSTVPAGITGGVLGGGAGGILGQTLLGGLKKNPAAPIAGALGGALIGSTLGGSSGIGTIKARDKAVLGLEQSTQDLQDLEESEGQLLTQSAMEDLPPEQITPTLDEKNRESDRVYGQGNKAYQSHARRINRRAVEHADAIHGTAIGGGAGLALGGLGAKMLPKKYKPFSSLAPVLGGAAGGMLLSPSTFGDADDK